MAKSGPCLKCTDRTITCHVVCKKYQAWKKEHDDVQEWLKDKNSSPTSDGAKRAYDDKAMRRSRGLEKKRRKYE